MAKRKAKGNATTKTSHTDLISRGVYSINTTAVVLDTTPRAVRARIARKQLPYRKLGGRVVVPIAELHQVMDHLAGLSAAEVIKNLRSP
jgi:hypothetical protein